VFFEAEFWVAVAFLIFVGIVVYLGAPALIARALDGRVERVKAELGEARRLRDEAQALLAEYRRKRQDAEKEAESIILDAKREGERLRAEAAARLEEFVARRTRMAETKIGQAEAQALADVRAAAADAAVAAAEKILAQSVKGQVGDELIAQGIKDVKAKLN
jgi:F-type H+-transporting ATPase subunit b